MAEAHISYIVCYPIRIGNELQWFIEETWFFTFHYISVWASRFVVRGRYARQYKRPLISPSQPSAVIPFTSILDSVYKRQHHGMRVFLPLTVYCSKEKVKKVSTAVNNLDICSREPLILHAARVWRQVSRAGPRHIEETQLDLHSLAYTAYGERGLYETAVLGFTRASE